MNPEYPIYVVSKGRWESRLTVKALEYMRVPFHLIVEADEYEEYAKVVDPSKILITPQKYIDEYDVFWEDDDPRIGPGASRNFAREHSMARGYDWHWVMDDNLDAFHRLNRNIKAEVTSGTIFKCMEDFVKRYDNVVPPSFERRLGYHSIQRFPSRKSHHTTHERGQPRTILFPRRHISKI